MQGRWVRVGDIRVSVKRDEGGQFENMFRQVSYVCSDMSAVITRIGIRTHQHISSGQLQRNISFTFSPVHIDQILKFCDANDIHYRERIETFTQFKDNDDAMTELEAKIYTGELEFDEINLKKILKFFAEFNSKNDRKPFSDRLQNELIALHKAIADKNCDSFEHSISAYPQSGRSRDADARPLYENLACQLAFEKSPHRIVKKYLLEGDDPDEEQGDGCTYTPLLYAILRHKKIDFLELLLWYKADPFLRHRNHYSGICTFSPFEAAIAFGQYDKANMIVAEYSRMKKMLALPRPDSYKVAHSTVNYVNRKIQTEFKFTNSVIIRTVLNDVAMLKDDERNAVFSLFKHAFEVPADVADSSIAKIFLEDFREKKLIDLIYADRQIVGFNLYEIIQKEGDKDKVFLHCVYSVIAPEYRGFGLMVMLTFRMAYILALSLNSIEIGVFFCSVHYNSYRMLNFSHYPKYQNDQSKALVTMLLDKIFAGDYVHYQDLITSYVRDQLRVRGSSKVQMDSSINERLYKKEIMGLDDDNEDKTHTRAAPILFFVDKDNYTAMRELAKKITLNFDAHVLVYAEYMQRYLVDVLGERFLGNTIHHVKRHSGI